MPRPWTVVELVPTPEGPLELRKRGDNDFLIVIGGRVLMSSNEVRTERMVAWVACASLAGVKAPRVLIGGLGMAFTLRAALDVLPADAQVTTVELNPVVERWCRGPLAARNAHPLDDPRSTVVIGDAAAAIAATPPTKRWHAIVLDLYAGPNQATQGRDDPFYSATALAITKRALLPGGALSVWSEEPDAAFEARLGRAGFISERVPRPESGPRHVVYVARTPV